jgi:hypothetical protein
MDAARRFLSKLRHSANCETGGIGVGCWVELCGVEGTRAVMNGQLGTVVAWPLESNRDVTGKL